MPIYHSIFYTHNLRKFTTSLPKHVYHQLHWPVSFKTTKFPGTFRWISMQNLHLAISNSSIFDVPTRMIAPIRSGVNLCAPFGSALHHILMAPHEYICIWNYSHIYTFFQPMLGKVRPLLIVCAQSPIEYMQNGGACVTWQIVCRVYYPLTWKQRHSHRHWLTWIGVNGGQYTVLVLRRVLLSYICKRFAVSELHSTQLAFLPIQTYKTRVGIIWQHTHTH